MMTRIAALLVAGAALAVGVYDRAAVDAGASSRSSCTPTTVHYAPYAGVESGLAPIPWISAIPGSTGIVGHLFYYDGGNVWKQQERVGLHIYSGGRSPDGRVNMKILWELRHGSAPGFLIRGTRLDSAGSFTQRLQGGGVQFPSIIDVPAPGCWRLTLTAGKLIGRVTFAAVRGTPS